MTLLYVVTRSYVTSAKIFTSYLDETPNDWVIRFLLKWLKNRLDKIVAEGKDYRFETDYYRSKTSHADCVKIAQRAADVLAISNAAYDTMLVRWCRVFLS